jgi:Arc/MetJ-type ribon-helix-helix transcriptional regulator
MSERDEEREKERMEREEERARERTEREVERAQRKIHRAEEKIRRAEEKIKRKKGIIVTIGEQVEDAIRQALGSRGNVVMVRVGDETLAKLDVLVESGLFKSRSESAAFLIQSGINANQELFDKIQAKIDEITKLRGELKNIFKDNVQGVDIEEVQEEEEEEDEKEEDEEEEE